MNKEQLIEIAIALEEMRAQEKKDAKLKKIQDSINFYKKQKREYLIQFLPEQLKDKEQ